MRAVVIRSLLLGGADGLPGETPVVHLVGARITGKLRLVFAEACCVMRLEEGWFEYEPQLYGVRLHVTGFGGSYLPGLQANSITVEGESGPDEHPYPGKAEPDQCPRRRQPAPPRRPPVPA
ncbi:hypothetical protein ACFTZK_08115 [Streptomyces decoyicus]|uniref:hypothetical protein n=1 Tax=Streptomyces decoyicus TaxID=249567 RepID=UPI0036274575